MPQLPDSEVAARGLLNGEDQPGDKDECFFKAAQIAWAYLRAGHDIGTYTEDTLLSDYGAVMVDLLGSEREARRTLSNVWRNWEDQPEHWQTHGDQEAVKAAARKLLLRLMVADFGTGKRAVSLRRTALALVDVCAERGAYTFRCAERWLASQVGTTDRNTANRWLSDLERVGLLTVITRSRRGGRSSRWVAIRLDWHDFRRAQETYQLSKSPDLTLSGVPSVHTVVRHDVFSTSRQALGPVAGWIWVLGADRSSKELAAILGVHRNTIDRAKAALSASDLSDLDALAERLGCAGHRARIQYVHDCAVDDDRHQRRQWWADQTAEFDRIKREIGAVMLEEAVRLGATRGQPPGPDPFASID